MCSICNINTSRCEFHCLLRQALVSHQLLAGVLIYSPEDFETTVYPYLANTYALLISALISIVRSNLTQNDGIFVLVSIASPATLYLWNTTFFDLINLVLSWELPEWWGYKVDKNRRLFLQFLLIGSFLFWIIMIAIIVGSPGDIRFSQPACSKHYGLRGWLTLIWLLPYLFQLFVLIIGMNLLVPFKLANDRRILSCVISSIDIRGNHDPFFFLQGATAQPPAMDERFFHSSLAKSQEISYI